MPPFFVEDMTDAQKAEYMEYLKKSKGGNVMECTHDAIRCTNCVKFCLKCGKELPADFIPGKHTQTAETPVNGQETPKKATRKKGVK